MKNFSNIMVFVLVVAGLVGVYFLLSAIAERQLKNNLLEKLGDSLSYEELDINVIAGNIRLVEPEFTTDEQLISSRELSIRGFSYYQYLVNGRIQIDKVLLLFPEIVISTLNSGSETPGTGLEESVEIGSLEMRGGSFILKDSIDQQLYFRLNEFELSRIGINKASVREKIPFTYETYKVRGDSLHLNLGPLHFLTAGTTALRDGKASVENINVIPRYGKREHQQHVPHEKDRFDVSIERVESAGLSFSFKKDTLHLTDSLLSITGADIQIFRDKLQPDEERIKPLYSQQIRELPIKLELSEVELKNSSVVYEERLQETGPPATVSFRDLHGNITSIVNVDLEREDFPETRITASAQFMDTTPLEVDWSFTANDLEDRFLIRANFGSLQGSDLDPFIKPAMRVSADGTIHSIAMTFSGNDDQAIGDMRLHYENFKVNVLKDDGEERSDFLSALANLFVKNEGFNRELVHEDLEVTRDKERSFWNYMWLCLRKGAFEHLLRV